MKELFTDDWSPEVQSWTLAWVRRLLGQALTDRGQPAIPDPLQIPEALIKPGASFVTLHKEGALRGCMGSLEAQVSLVQDIYHNALAAAFRDPRFPPLKQPELPLIRLEISLLDPPEILDYRDPQDLLDHLQQEKPGLVLQQGWRRATFLPQVWEQLPRAENFLSQLCLKAGLTESAWQEEGLELKTYGVRHFSEEP